MKLLTRFAGRPWYYFGFLILFLGLKKIGEEITEILDLIPR